MSRDKNLPCLDAQTILGHALVEQLAERELRARQAPLSVAVGYEADDMPVLFGGRPR